MKPQIYLLISFRIIILFTIAFFTSWAVEANHQWIGDTWNIGSPETASRIAIEAHWDWSARHYWFVWCGIILFVFSLTDIIIHFAYLLQKHYPNLFK